MTSCYWRIPRVLNACFHLTLLLSFSVNTTIRLDIMLLTYSASVERVFPSHSTVELLHQHDHTSGHHATDVFRECWTRVSISLYCWASPLTRPYVLTSCYWRIPRVLNACFHLTLLLSFSVNTTIRLDIMLLTYSASVERVFPSLLLSFSVNTTIRLDIMLLTYSASVERVFPSHSTVELLR